MIQDDPIISSLLRTGEPPWAKKMPICPLCGMECDTVYRDVYGSIVGCENCIEAVDAWEVLDERRD